MFAPPSNRCRVRRGTVAVYVAVSLTMLTGVLAIAVDASNMQARHRQAQNAVDSAALAAATSMYKTSPYTGIVDQNAVTAAQNIAATYGFKNGGSVDGGTIQVTAVQALALGKPTYNGAALNLAAQGNGTTGYVQVTIAYPQQRFFSTIWGSQTVTGSVTAVARGVKTQIQSGGGSASILVLNQTSPNPTLNITGNGSAITDDDGSVVVNSPNAGGLTMTGNGSIKTGRLNLAGPTYSGSGNARTTDDEGRDITPNYNGIPTEDPYAGMTPPSPSQLPSQAAVNLSGKQSVTLSPGVYPSIVSTGQGSVTFKPGVYIITGGSGGKGFNLTGQGNVTVDTSSVDTGPFNTGTGVLIYFTGGTATLTGNGSIFNLPAPTSGPYSGISMWIDKNDSDANDDNGENGNKGFDITGNGNMNVGGVLYGPTTRAVLTGNGDTMGSQLVVDLLTLTGNGNVKVGKNANKTPPPPTPVNVLGLVQ